MEQLLHRSCFPYLPAFLPPQLPVLNRTFSHTCLLDKWFSFFNFLTNCSGNLVSQAQGCVCNPPLTPTLGGSGGHSEEAQDAQPFASSDLCSLETSVRSSGEKSPRDCLLFPASCGACGLQRPHRWRLWVLFFRQLNLHRNLERRHDGLKMSSFQSAESLALGLGQRSGQCWSSPSRVTPSCEGGPSGLLWYSHCHSPCHHPILHLGGCALNVLLLLMLLKPCGHWPVLASCPPHLSFCLVCPNPSPCVNLPTSGLVSEPTAGLAAPWFWGPCLGGLLWVLVEKVLPL